MARYYALVFLLATMMLLPVMSVPSCNFGCSRPSQRKWEHIGTEFNGKTISVIKQDPEDKDFIHVIFTDGSVMRVRSAKYGHLKVE